MCSIFPNWLWLLGGRWMAGKDLPAVLYNILANSLEEKILHMASACTVFGQQKMIKVSLKMVSCVAF